MADDATGYDTIAGRGGLGIRAAFRVVLAAVIGGLLLFDADDDPSTVAHVVPLLAGLYVVVSAVLVWSHRHVERAGPSAQRPDVVRAVLDVVAICAAAVAVDRPRMAILMVLCAVPLGYGLTLTASAVAMLTAVGVGGGLLIWALAPTIGAAPLSEGSLLLLAFAIAWCGLIACVIAVERERRAQRIRELSGSVRDMLRQTLRAEAGERARVADLLHDDVLQLLLATRHDISDAIDGDLDLLPEARSGIEAATRRLRETIVTLRDESATDQGLGAGLRSLAGDATALRGVEVAADIDATLGDSIHPVLLSAARGFFRDAENASAATAISLAVTREGGVLAMELRHHDPRHALGLEWSPESAALAADVEARVVAVGGTLSIGHIGDDRVINVLVPERARRSDAATSGSPPPSIAIPRTLGVRDSPGLPTQKLG